MDNKIGIKKELFQRNRDFFEEVDEQKENKIGKRLKKELMINKVACISIILLLLIVLAVMMAPLSPYDPYKIDRSQKLQDASLQHWLGTDEYGRDYFTRALYGGRVSLAVGVCTMFATTGIGTILGVCTGYFGGRVDTVLMRFTDLFLALPSLLLMIILNTILRPGLITLILVMSLFSWAPVARITRAETMSVKEREYVIASEGLGAGRLMIIFHHVIPNILGPIVVASTLGVANSILMESALSFLGLGVQIPTASWGSMLQEAQPYILNHPLLAVFPGILILVTVLGFNMLGNVLQNVFDDRKRK